MRHATYVWPLCLLMNHPRLIVEVIMSLVAEHRMQITATTWRCSTVLISQCHALCIIGMLVFENVSWFAMPRTYDGAGRRQILLQQVVTPTTRNLLRDPETLQRFFKICFRPLGVVRLSERFLLPRPIDRNVMDVRTLLVQYCTDPTKEGRSWQFVSSRVFEYNFFHKFRPPTNAWRHNIKREEGEGMPV